MVKNLIESLFVIGMRLYKFISKAIGRLYIGKNRQLLNFDFLHILFFSKFLGSGVFESSFFLTKNQENCDENKFRSGK